MEVCLAILPQFQSSLLNQMFESDLSFNPPDCFIYLKIYKNTGSSTPFQLMYELGSGDNPMLIYQCADQDCGMLEDELFVIPSNACFSPNNPQNTNNGLVPYMGSCPLSSSTISVTTINGSNSGGILGSNEYSTEPLAPLPGFTGNPDLGQWLESLFTILIVIAGLLALIMIIVGGITYITSESFGDKGKGKSYIMNAIAGLVLALGAWVILNTINPNLAEDLNIKIPTVSLSIGDADSFSSSESTDSSGTITGNTPLPNIGLVCPMNGGSSSVASIIDSFENKTTYRWGGKGGPLPVGGRFKLSPSEQSGGPQTCTNSDGGQAECRSFCPIDSVCLDCSGFVNQVRRCSGLPTYSGTSSMVNNQDAIPVDMDNLSSDGQSIIINGAQYTLQSGDILVWNGHVVMYYGAGQIAESAGALTTNSNIKKSQLSSYVGKNRITHLIKVNP
jgi:cell wall-associated NlpC family hydrolase